MWILGRALPKKENLHLFKATVAEVNYQAWMGAAQSPTLLDRDADYSERCAATARRSPRCRVRAVQQKEQEDTQH